MAIGERIRFLRNLHGATQKWLGIKLGFSEKTAETRVGQYEIGVRTPKDDMIKDIAKIFGVSPQAIKLPDIDNYDALLHTLFAIEDIYGLTINMLDDEFKTVIVLRDMEGMDYKEISDITGLPLGTVKSRLSRGRGKLRQMIEKFNLKPETEGRGRV